MFCLHIKTYSMDITTREFVENRRNEALMENLKTRKATADDLDSIIALHLSCFSKETSYASRFGVPFLQKLYLWFITCDTNYIFVAEVDGKIVGLTAGCDRPYSGVILRIARKEIFRAIIDKPWLVLNQDLIERLIRYVFRRKVEVGTGFVYAAYGMVALQYRKRGIHAALWEQVYRVCRERGIENIVTSIRRSEMPIYRFFVNTGAYEKSDWSTKGFVYMVDKVPKSVAAKSEMKNFENFPSKDNLFLTVNSRPQK